MVLPSAEQPDSPHFGPRIAALLGLLGAWFAAGSMGLMAHPLRKGATLATLLAIAVAAWPRRGRLVPTAATAGVVALAAAAMVSLALPAANVFAVVLVLAALALGHSGAERRWLLWSAEAASLLALYRLAVTSIPALWLAADSVGQALGVAAGEVTRQSLNVGATFAGLDFLLVMVYLAVRVPLSSSGGYRPQRVAVALAVVFVGHMIYLNVLAWSPLLVDRLPKPSPPGTPWTPYPPPPGLNRAVAQWSSQLPGLRPVIEPVLGAAFRIGQRVQSWIPWNLPALAAMLHLVGAWVILPWLAACRGLSGHGPVEEAASSAGRGARSGWPPALPFGAALTAGAVVAAALLPVVTCLVWQRERPTLAGKKIVVYEKFFGNWSRPEYPKKFSPPGRDAYGNLIYADWGRLSIGMYGMMPVHLESLGAEPVVSPQLSEEDLRGADAVLLIYPNDPWEDGQLDRLRRYVEEGGTLLVVGEHTQLETALVEQHKGVDPTLAEDLEQHAGATEGARSGERTLTEEQLALQRKMTERVREFARQAPENRFNELLASTGTPIRVAFDCSEFAVGGWLQSYEALAHPASAGLDDAQNVFGPVVGGTLEVRWPAWPLLVGRFGWSDWGDPISDDSKMGNVRYDAGERLGDVVLAAETSVGRGRVVVFGDTSGFSNGLSMGCHPYTSRLFNYLANRVPASHAPGRQAAGFLLVLALAAALIVGGRPERLAAVAAVATISLWACTEATARTWTIYPDGSLPRHRWTTLDNGKRIERSKEVEVPGEPTPAGHNVPNNLAYIDACHLNANSAEGWRTVPGQAAVDDGLMGLALNLMRSGYLVLDLPELTRERLLTASDGPAQKPRWQCRARLLISVAPAREYSAGEREVLKDFLEAGGIFICTVGYEDQGPSRKLLEELEFFVGGRRWQYVEGTDEKAPLIHFKAGASDNLWSDSLGQPKPLGYFKAPFAWGKDREFENFVRFHAAWPVECSDRAHVVVARGALDAPVIALRRYRTNGLIAVIGDTCFAMNKNLEVEGGYPFEGLRENPVFWRWFLSMLREGLKEGEIWLPGKIDTISEYDLEQQPPGPKGTPPGP